MTGATTAHPLRVPLGLGELYALVDGHLSDGGAAREERVRFVHVIHPASEGEIRGYELREDGRAHLRYPTFDWPEVDAVVAKALAVEVVTSPAGQVST